MFMEFEKQIKDKNYPMWMYNEDGDSELVKSPEEKSEYLENGWKESPADFFSKKDKNLIDSLDREGLIQFAQNRLGILISRNYATKNMRQIIKNKFKQRKLNEPEKLDQENGEGDNDN